MLFATADAAGNTGFLQAPFDFREDLLNHLLTVTTCGFHHLFDHPEAVRVQGFKTQLFQLGFNVMNT